MSELLDDCVAMQPIEMLAFLDRCLRGTTVFLSYMLTSGQRIESVAHSLRGTTVRLS